MGTEKAKDWKPHHFGQKKKTARALSYSCREASDANFSQLLGGILAPSSLRYIHHTIDSEESKYKNRYFRWEGSEGTARFGYVSKTGALQPRECLLHRVKVLVYIRKSADIKTL